MRQSVSYSALSNPHVITFIDTWKKRKKYDEAQTLTIGQCMELMIGVSYNLHFEESDGRFFNKILTNAESLVGWDGEELIDILFYELVTTIQKRIASSGTFSEETGT